MPRMRLMDLRRHKALGVHPVADRGVAHHARCLQVVLDRLAGMALRQQHVLVDLGPRGFISRCGPICLFRCHTAAVQVRERTYRLGATPGSIRRTAIVARGLTRDVSDSSRTTLDKYGHAASVIAKTSSSLGPPPSSLRADLFLRGCARPVRQPGIGRRENLPAERHFHNDIVVIPSVNNGTLSGSIGRIVRKSPHAGRPRGRARPASDRARRPWSRDSGR